MSYEAEHVTPQALVEHIAEQDEVYLVVSEAGYVAAHPTAVSAAVDYTKRLDSGLGEVVILKRRSKQKKHGGGKFKSERQRKFLWAVAPKAAKKWAHNRKTRKPDWGGKKIKGGRAKARPG